MKYFIIVVIIMIGSIGFNQLNHGIKLIETSNAKKHEQIELAFK